MKKLTKFQKKVEEINCLFDDYLYANNLEKEDAYIKHKKSEMKRVQVRECDLLEFYNDKAIYKSDASYKVFVGSYATSYVKYISTDFVDYAVSKLRAKQAKQ